MPLAYNVVRNARLFLLPACVCVRVCMYEYMYTCALYVPPPSSPHPPYSSYSCTFLCSSFFLLSILFIFRNPFVQVFFCPVVAFFVFVHFRPLFCVSPRSFFSLCVDANCLYVYALRCVNVYVCTYVREKNDEVEGRLCAMFWFFVVDVYPCLTFGKKG